MLEPTYKIAQRLHERRAAKGLETYGLHLGPFNGRSSIIDAIEESADMLVYLLNIAQESRHLLMDLMINSVRLREAGHADAADGLDKIIVGMGGKDALAQYDEILGTVAENATADPRDEALQLADKALAKVIDHLGGKEFVSFHENHLMTLANEARESIRAAGGAR